MNKKDFIFGLICGVLIAAMIGSTVLAVGLFDENRKIDASVPFITNIQYVFGGNPNAALTTAQAEVAPAKNALESYNESPVVDAPITESDFVIGPANARVSIVFYYDLQCPYSAKFVTVIGQTIAKYGDSVRFAFRHYPLESIHTQARLAANATECAREQAGNTAGWEFIQALSTSGETYNTQAFQKIAEANGLKGGAFSRCLETTPYNQRVTDQQTAADALGVTGTPNLIINEKFITGGMSFTDLSKIIDSL